ncbi:ABC transporter substrate-binding protein [Paenibacillus sp. GCM10027626]|uniref:ABC transporter substrate-binding protein n=1 Tax=Paenibacillus sp. GCM10027626 TaxID=3273411 RepID=UPI0036294CE2
MNKKYSISLLCIMMSTTAALTACTPEKSNPNVESGTSKGDGKTSAASVVFTNGDWPKPTDASLAQSEAWKATFDAKYPNVEMKTEHFEFDTNTFLPKAESGQLPNLFTTWLTEPQKIINAGYAADLTDVLKEYGYDSVLNPDMLSMMQKDGRTYGIPTNGYYMGVWYNVNLLKQAGLMEEGGVPKFPQTYEELVEMAKTIKEKTGKPGFFLPTKNNQGGWQFMNIAWSYGTEFVVQEDGKWKAVFNSPEAVAALQLIKDMKWKHNVLTDNVLVDINDLFRLFGTDQVGMSFGTLDWKNDPINDYKMSRDNLAMSKVPGGPAGRYTLTGGGLYMFSPSSSPEQIRAGLDWLKIKGFSPEVAAESLQGLEEQLKGDAELGRVVGPRGLKMWINEDRLQAEQAIYDKFTNVDMALWNDYINNEGVTIRPEVPVNAQELYKLLDGVIQAVLTKENADPQALLDKAAADFQRDYLDKVEQ